jgi:4-hydroxythreonine-4-phosphate dehydrogenase
MTKRILITLGEPAGIGPDIAIQAAQRAWPVELIAIADPVLLTARAKTLRLPLHLSEANLTATAETHRAGTLKIIPQTLTETVMPGTLNAKHAQSIIHALTQATQLAKTGQVDALITGPVHKGIINQAGLPFTGHTEFFEKETRSEGTVMLFVVGSLKVALLTTHVPLSAVSQAITPEKLEKTIRILHKSLQQQFNIAHPRILVCGLNPHAGEGGFLGREEIDCIAPTLVALQQAGFHLQGPLAADTLFTAKQLQQGDAILAMYHDQALPVVKYIGFDEAVNITLGLPFIRTSPDHGVALDVAGRGKARPNSFIKAIEWAITLSGDHHVHLEKRHQS